jgi:hypothetical protein
MMSCEHAGDRWHFVVISGKTRAKINYKHVSFPRNRPVFAGAAVSAGKNN